MRVLIRAGVDRAAVIAAAVALLLGPAVVPASAQSSRRFPEVVVVSRPSAGMLPVRAPATAVRRVPICGTATLNPAEAEGVRSVLRRWSEEDAGARAGGTIRVAVHVITARGEGAVTDDRIARQIDELNRAFGAGGYRFELSRVDRTEDPEWFRMTPGSGAERGAMQALAVEPARHLNLYVCGPGLGLSGWASAPWSSPEGSSTQGVVLDHTALAGGSDPHDPGLVAIHQVGHYLGLVHEAAVAGAGLEGFNPDQTAHLRDIVTIYRPSLFSSPAPRSVAKPEISPSEGAEPEEGRVLSYRGAFPNPFRAETLLRFTLPGSGPVSLRIYSVTGQLVRTLVDAALPPGDHSAMFRADDLPSGAYFAVLRAGSVQMNRTLMLVR
jgi:hypothetical protein